MTRRTFEPHCEKRDFFAGMRAGLPVFVGYFPIALTFGVLATQVVSLCAASTLSAFVYAGASQFMSLRLLEGGTPLGQVVLAVFMLNFRHFLMNSALARRVSRPGRALAPVLAFLVTDETFSVFMNSNRKPTPLFLLGLELVAYSAWVGGTALGYLAGSFLPALLQRSLWIALYALFIALLVPAVKRRLFVGFVAALAGGLHTLLSRIGVIGPGWAIVVSIASAALVGALLFRRPPAQDAARASGESAFSPAGGEIDARRSGR